MAVRRALAYTHTRAPTRIHYEPFEPPKGTGLLPRAVARRSRRQDFISFDISATLLPRVLLYTLYVCVSTERFARDNGFGLPYAYVQQDLYLKINCTLCNHYFPYFFTGPGKSLELALATIIRAACTLDGNSMYVRRNHMHGK